MCWEILEKQVYTPSLKVKFSAYSFNGRLYHHAEYFVGGDKPLIKAGHNLYSGSQCQDNLWFEEPTARNQIPASDLPGNGYNEGQSPRSASDPTAA